MPDTLNNLAEAINHLQIPMFGLSVGDNRKVRFIALNPAHEQQSGLDASSLIGKTPQEALPPDVAASITERYRECIQAKALYAYEEQLSLPNGIAWWRTTLSPVLQDNEVIGIIGFGVNIDAEKKVEQDLNKATAEIAKINGDMQVLVATTSHDLRGPVQQFRAVIELLKAGKPALTDEQDELADLGDEIAAKALRQIDDNLKYASGAMTDDTGQSQVDLKAWCNNIGLLHDPLSQLEISAAGVTIQCEHFALDIALRNLMDNAIKYARSKVQVSVDKQDSVLTFVVSDDGPGFPDDTFVIGEPLPVDDIASRKKTSGFGLSAAKRLVEARGGQMWVSEPQLKPAGASVAFSVKGSVLKPDGQ